LADAKDVLAAIQNVEGARFPVLTPNIKVSVILNGKNINLEFVGGHGYLNPSHPGF